MSEVTKAAIVIASFNCARYLRESIESARAQDFDGQLDVIVVDDGSTDETPEVCDALKNLITKDENTHS